jgi:hypothetical protein
MLDGEKYSVSYTSHLTSMKRFSDAHWIGGWVSSKAGLDAVLWEKFLPLPGIKP